MRPEELIEFLETMEQLKCNLRHSWTTSGRKESVAEHSWRLAVMAYLIRDEFSELNMDKVMKMCLIHDWGEAVTGDIPAFEKTRDDEIVEDAAVNSLAGRISGPVGREIAGLFAEMSACGTREAKLAKALDKLETLIQHNEAGRDTWLPLEYDLNLVYGNKEADEFPYTRELREIVRDRTRKIIREDAGESTAL